MKFPYLSTDRLSATLFIRLMVGLVFVTEGLLKFLFPDLWGAARFASLDIPAPGFFAAFIGGTEMICGFLILIGLVTRLATIPLILIMLTAFGITKAGIFVSDGIWGVLHASRTDLSMLLGNIFLLMQGGGRWSLDLMLITRKTSEP